MLLINKSLTCLKISFHVTMSVIQIDSNGCYCLDRECGKSTENMIRHCQWCNNFPMQKQAAKKCLQVARQCDPAEAQSDPINPCGSGTLTLHPLTGFVQPYVIPAPQNKTLLQFQGSKQEKLKGDKSYSNQSIVLNKLFSKIEDILKH